MTDSRTKFSASPRFPRGLALLAMGVALALFICARPKSDQNHTAEGTENSITWQTSSPAVIPAQSNQRLSRQSLSPGEQWVAAFTPIEMGESQYRREEMWGELASGIALADISVSLDELRRAGLEGHEFTQRLLRRWAEANARAAVDWVAQLPPGVFRESALSAVATEWANTDLESAAVWARQLPDQSEQQATLLTVAGEAVRSNPLESLRIATELLATPGRDEIIRRAAMEWAMQDADAAVAWTSKIPDPALRSQILAAAAIAWADAVPESAATLAIETLSPGRLLDDTVVSIVQRWTQQRPEQAAAWVKQFPEGPLQVAALENLLMLWPEESRGL